MHRQFVVEGETAVAMTDFVDAAGNVEPSQRRRGGRGGSRLGPIARADRIAPEGVLDVGHEQLLMLLLMLQAELDQRQDRGPRGAGGGFDQRRHRAIDMLAVASDLVDARTRQQTARRAGVARPDGFIIGIEQIAEARIEHAIIARVRAQQKRLEEPCGVRAMPLRRTCVGHRLDRLILGRQRLGEHLGGGAHGDIAIQHDGSLIRARIFRGYRHRAADRCFRGILPPSYRRTATEARSFPPDGASPPVLA